MTEHDLHEFMSQLTDDIGAEYHRIRKSAKGDPGTAGDEGEENWAKILRDWLPSTYHVVTKGQIINNEGELSPQVDIVVLYPTYPPFLLNKKKYLADGVAAAFECKLTLKKRDIYKAMSNSARIKRLIHSDKGTPYKELTSPIIFGLLAHSHSWRNYRDQVIDIIDDHLFNSDYKHIKHPREMLDLVCVSDLAIWAGYKMTLLNPQDEGSPEYREMLPSEPYPGTLYDHIWGNPIGVFISELLDKLSWKDIQLQAIARYFGGVFASTAVGKIRVWSREIYSKGLNEKLTLDSLDSEGDWSEWSPQIS